MAKTIRITWKDGSRYVVSEPNWDGGLVVELAECERMVREAIRTCIELNHTEGLTAWDEDSIVREVMGGGE